MSDVNLQGQGWHTVVPVTGDSQAVELALYQRTFESVMLKPDVVPLDVNVVRFCVQLVTGTTLYYTTYVRSDLTFNYADACQRLAMYLSKHAMLRGQPAVHDVTCSVEPIVPSIVVMDVSGGVRYDHK